MTEIKPLSIQSKHHYNYLSLKWIAIGVVLALLYLVMEGKYGY